jgi:MFS family permease
LSLAFGLWQLAILAVIVHLVPFLVGIGIAPQVAATVLGVTTIASIIGRLGFGWLADRMRKQLAAGMAMGLVALGAAIAAHITAWWHFIFFIPIFAVGWGGGVPLTHTLRGEWFGRRAFGTISGAMDAVQLFGLVGGPILAGLIFDATQSYYPAFLAAAGAAALGAGIVLLVRAPAHPPARFHAFASTGNQK